MTLHANYQVFLYDETGQDMVEYGLIVGLMALGAVLTLKNLASSIANTFAAVGNTLTSSS